MFIVLTEFKKPSTVFTGLTLRDRRAPRADIGYKTIGLPRAPHKSC